MKPAAFEYVRAQTVDHAIELLSEARGDAAVLAGGQSLAPTLNLRLARPQTLIDIKRIAALRTIDADDNVMSIGAAWTHAEIEDGVVPDVTQGFMAFVARGIAYRAIRNRGTLGGSLAHADPAADWVSAAVALGARLNLQGPAGAIRRVCATEFFQGAFNTQRSETEVLTSIDVPRLSPRTRWGYWKVCRKKGEFAKAIGVAIQDPASGFSRVVAGALSSNPVLLPQSSQGLQEGGSKLATDLVTDELRGLLRGVDATHELHAVAIRRALSQMS